MITTANLENYHLAIAEALARLASERVVERIWDKDWTVWKKESEDISNRLGWLNSPESAGKSLAEICQLVREIRGDEYTHALLLGMGGSSLAPEVMSNVFSTRRGFLRLAVLDSTDPAAVSGFAKKLRPEKTLFIVSSKSGTTAETTSFLNFFWNRVCGSLGENNAGRHFIAITDPGTPLEAQAQRLQFRSVSHGDPEVGGRFSALSPFGLLPAALQGIDTPRILRSAKKMAEKCRDSNNLRANPGAYLGTLLGILAQRGRDKLTLFISPRLKSWGAWLEQLVAESTGKDGKGILPVDGEPPGPPRVYDQDRIFIDMKLGKDSPFGSARRRLGRAGFPVISIGPPSPYGLGGQFFLWEFATAVAGFFLEINPFDQPNVDSAKKKTREILQIFQEKGVFPEAEPQLREAGVSLFSDIPAPSLNAGLEKFLKQGKQGDYVSIQAFLAPSPQTTQSLGMIRIALRKKTGLATTVGYGPRFLHSTGQLHKGDRGNGLFIQLTADDIQDLAVPDEPGSSRSALSFSVLKSAQARGDYEALRASGRRIIRFHLGRDIGAGLAIILSLFD